MLLLAMLGFSNASLALNESEAEDLADLTAVFIYLKMIAATTICQMRKSNAPSSISRNKTAGI